MTRLGRLQERLPALYRPEPGEGGLVPGLLSSVATVLEEASAEAADVLQSRWWAYADRAAYNRFFLLSRALDGSLREEEFRHIHDLARVAALLPFSPREEPAVHRDTVESYRLRIARVVELFRGGLGTLEALRRIIEIELPLVPGVGPERRDRPFLLEEHHPESRGVTVVPDGAPGGTGLLGPMMRFRVENQGVVSRPPTVYFHGVAPEPHQVEATVNPMVELYRTGGALPRVGLAYVGTVPPGDSLRLRPTYTSWIGGEDGVLRGEAIPEGELGADPTAPGPWSPEAEGPEGPVGALARSQDHAVWAAVPAVGGSALHRRGALGWDEVLTGVPEVRAMLADGPWLLLATSEGVLRVELHPAAGGPPEVQPMPGLEELDARALLLDGEGALWVGAEGAVVRLPPGGPPETIPLEDAAGDPIPVHALAPDDGLGLLLGTELGLILLRPGGEEWFWYGGEGFTEQHRQWHRVGPGSQGEARPSAPRVFLPPVLSLLRGPDASIWLGTTRGVARYLAQRPARESGGRQVVEMVFRPAVEALPDVSDAPVHQIRVDERGVVWFAGGAGLQRFDGRDWWQHREAGGWAQMGRADTLYPEGRPPESRGAWRFHRGGDRWQRFDTARSDWSDFSDPPRGTAEAPARAILWTDGVVAELGSWDAEAFTPSEPVPAESLRLRYKPSEDRVVDGGIPALPRVPPGVSVWRYLSMEEGAGEGDGEAGDRTTPWWTTEGRMVPPTIPEFTLEEAPPPGRFDRAQPTPPTVWDNSVYAYLPSAGIRMEWETRRPRRVLARLLSAPDAEPLDPAILDRVWDGMLRVRPAGVRVSLAIDEQIVREG